MTWETQKIAIVGAGVAGLCAAVYARTCGFDVDLIEQHETPGGLATRWRRGDYAFETCLHWLLGSNPDGRLHDMWDEVCDTDLLQFVYHEEFVRLETEHSEVLRVFADVDCLEREFLRVAPEDAVEIRQFTAAVRHLTDLPLPDPSADWIERGWTMLRMLPEIPLLARLSRLSAESYGARFTHPLLRRFFGEGPSARMSVLALAFSLAWQSQHNAGYPIGGSQAVIGAIAQRLGDLGGHLRCGAVVERILVENDAAVGVQLAGGETIRSDWVISAADGHATIYQLLDGRYTDASVESVFDRYESFPSYLQVSFGVARDLSTEPGYLTIVLDAPIAIDPETRLEQLSYRIFHYDPTCAIAGKTAVTCFLPTANFGHWTALRSTDPARYHAEKARIGEAVIAVLERRIPGIRRAIEVIDISTPATVIRYTRNWKGSMQGWLITPETGLGAIPATLPGLDRFIRVGQWIQPGGGLPSGLMTARAALKTICRGAHVPFRNRTHTLEM
ncbi:NAD(P)/FAD-dependent oxidoreductase [Sphingomonas qilianensis]|uniref:NAD(P)/FAD-dependent oxidoreductase n=1 Tax=Sphingomonas qilianensis TaxID=1736690 RepID=A0ABU9XQK5_9SPHN